ncbi:hypothetical protein FRACYDRAFT_220405, partial [Fragilariopsis cylindrus CCMP1102]
GSVCKAAEPEILATNAPRNTNDNAPSIPDGIFDIIGPRTFDGGYSPSQYVSES